MRFWSSFFYWTKTFFGKIHFLLKKRVFFIFSRVYKSFEKHFIELHFVKMNIGYVLIDKKFSRHPKMFSWQPSYSPDLGENFWYLQWVDKRSRKFFEIKLREWIKFKKAFFELRKNIFHWKKKDFKDTLSFQNRFEKFFCSLSALFVVTRNVLQSQESNWVVTKIFLEV